MFSLLRRQRSFCLLMLAIVLIAPTLAAQAPQATVFTVTNTHDSGMGSLRQAILDANANAGDDTVNFNIPGSGPHVIALTAALPELTGPLDINGLTQSGAACDVWPPTLKIVLNGAAISDTNANGLLIGDSATPSTIRGLVIQNFPNNGIKGDDNASFTVDCNFIGTDVMGQVAAPNGWDGVAYSALTAETTQIMRNVISGNAQSGIYSNWRSIIEDNYIGTNVTGTAPLGNGNWGILLDGKGFDSVVRYNVIAHNGGDGIYVANGVFLYEYGPTTGIANLISRNSIFDNGKLGIDLHGKDDPPGGGIVTLNDPGDADAEENDPFAPVSGGNRLQNFPVLLGVSREAQTVSGVLNSKPEKTYFLEFFTNPTCDASGYGEGRDFIGETTVYTGVTDTITFNAHVTGELPEGYFVTATATDMHNNTSEFSLCLEIPHDSELITVTNTDDSGAGSLREAMLNANALEGFNVINFNIPGDGPHVITLLSPLPEITDPLDLNGLTQPGSTCEQPNVKLLVENVLGSTIRINTGDSTVQGLTVTQVGEDGAAIQLSGILGHNTVSCNLILQSNLDGIRIEEGSKKNVIEQNHIFQSAQSGIWVNAAGNKIKYNRIEQSGAWGVILDPYATKTQIRGNVILQSGNDGVFVKGGKYNALEQNIIYESGGLGIELYEPGYQKDNVPLPNDPGDADDGANAWQNHPIVTQALAGTNQVKGKLQSVPDKNFTIDLFINAACSPSGYGEGEFWAGSARVTTNALGNANFTIDLGGLIERGQFVTATARDAKGNTSEFSPCFAVSEMVELVYNGGFEDGMYGWTEQKLDGDKRVCNTGTAHKGVCAFRFNGFPGGNKGKLLQSLEVSKPDPGERVRFEVWVARYTANAGTGLAMLKITYADDTTEQIMLVVPAGGDPLKYQKVSKSFKVSRPIAQLQLLLQYPQLFGQLYVDDVSVKLFDTGVEEVLVPLPPAPDGIRSLN